jgi:hypothetical protein
MTLRGIPEAAHGSDKISNLGQNRISANRPSELVMVNGIFSAKFSPVEELLPNVTPERKAAYFSAASE